LFVALAAEGFRLLAEKLESAEAAQAMEAPTSQSYAAIGSLFRAYMSFAVERPALYKLMISRRGFESHSEACRLNSERALGCLLRAVQEAQARGWRSEKESMALVLSLWASVHGWAILIIEGLLPSGVLAEGEEWLGFAQSFIE
jgi:hypothetical protein